MLRLLKEVEGYIFSYYSFVENVEKVGLKSHKFKLFNPIDILTKTKY